MASTSQKVPIPLPVNGVISDRSPRQIGASGLVDAMNWQYKNGEFAVRPGLTQINSDSAINLFPKFVSTGKDESALAYINESVAVDTKNYYNDLDAGDLIESRLWIGYDLAAQTLLDTSALSFETWASGTDPAFLNNGGEGFAEIDLSGTVDPVSLCSPIVPISTGKYEAQIQVTDTAGGGEATLELYFAADILDGGPPFYVVLADSASATNLSYDSSAPVLRVSAENTTPYINFAFLKLTIRSENSIAFSRAQINVGDTAANFVLPGGAASERAMGISEFMEGGSTRTTVMATDTKLHELSGNLTWSSIASSEWNEAPSSPAALPVFRSFAGKNTEAGSGSSESTYLIVVNGESRSLFWDGTNAGQIRYENNTSTGAAIIAKCVAIAHNRVLYGNVATLASVSASGGDPGSVSPDMVVWSNALTVMDWGNDSDVLNYVHLADTPGEIVAMMEMGNLQTAIYKTDAIYTATAQGGAQPFRFEMKTANVDGPASARSVVALSDGVHMYLSVSGDIIIFDGVRPRSIGQRFQAYIQNNMSIDNMDRAFGFYDREHKTAYFFYPPYGGSDPTRCVSVDVSYDEPTLWPLKFSSPITAGGRTLINVSKTIDQLQGNIDDLEGTIDGFGSVRPILSMLDSSGALYGFEGTSDRGEPIDHYFETGLFDMGSVTQYKTIKEIDHLYDADNTESINVELISMDFGGYKKSDGEQNVLLRRRQRKLSKHRTTTRLAGLRKSGSSTGKIIWHGSEASVALRGLR